MTNYHKISEQLKKMEETELDPKKLLFFVYEHHEFFFLNYLEEDERYDFILSLMPLMKRIAATYDKKKASLEQYLRFIISRNKNSWQKASVKNHIKENLIQREYKLSLASDLLHDEEESFDAGAGFDYSAKFLKLPERFVSALPLLAYRASAYVTREQVLKIAKISKTNAEEMFRNIRILNDRLESRINNVRKIAQRKTSIYLMKCRYSFERDLLEGSASIRYETVAEKMDSIQEHYEKSLENQQSTQIVTPARLIAEVLGVSVYSIDNKLRYVHKLFPDFFKHKDTSQNE